MTPQALRPKLAGGHYPAGDSIRILPASVLLPRPNVRLCFPKAFLGYLQFMPDSEADSEKTE